MRESIIDISLGLQVYDVGNEENEDASVDKVHKKILERLHFRSRLLYFIRYICHVIPFFHTTKK